MTTIHETVKTRHAHEVGTTETYYRCFIYSTNPRYNDRWEETAETLTELRHLIVANKRDRYFDGNSTPQRVILTLVA